MAKAEGSSKLGTSGLLSEIKEMASVVNGLMSSSGEIDIKTDSIDKASEKLDSLDKKLKKKRKMDVDTSSLTEAQKIIQQYGKGGRSNYLVSEESALRNLTKAYEQYGKAISDAQKKQSKGDLIRWAGAYRGAGYDTSKVDKEVFDIADQLYSSFNIKQPNGRTTNQMHYYSPESMKKLFDAMRSEAGGKFDFSNNETYWGKTRRDTSIGKQSDIAEQTKRTVTDGVQQGVEDASKEKVEIPLDDILNVSIGKGKKDTIQKKVAALREELEKFYSKAYDKEGAYNQKADNTIDQYIRKYSEYAKYMGLMKQNVEQRYTDIYENIHKFSKTRTVVAPTKYKAGQDDFAQLKAQEMASAEGMVNDIWAKATRKASAQLAVGIKQSAKAGESGEDTGDKIAEGMKKAGEATQEVKEKIEQVGETGKNAGEKAASGMEKAAESAKKTRQEMEQASEAAKSVAEAEKSVDTASAKNNTESHSDAAKSAEEHAEKVKEVTQSIQEEVTATQQLNAEKEKSSQQNTQDNTAQQAKENEEALHKQAEAQREVNDAKEQSNDKSKLSSASQEISQVEQMEAALDFQKKKLYDLQKQAEAVKQVYDDLQDRNEYIKARRNVKGTKDKPNPFGLDGNLDKLYEQAIDHINRKEPNMAKAAAYYGFYRNAGGKDRAVVNGEDFTRQLVERWNAIQKLNKAIREGSINASDYGVDSLNAANEAIREQQRIVDNVTEKVSQTKKEAAEQRKAERELAVQEYEDSKIVWSQGLNEQEIAGVEAYLKKVKALKKEAYNETDALAKAMSLVEKIKKRDISGLMDQFTKDTPENNALLGKITEMPVRSQKQRNAAIRSINQEQYDQLIKGQTEAVVEQGMQGVADASKDAATSGTTAMEDIGQAAAKAGSQVNEVYEAVEKIMHLSWNGGESFMNFDLNGLTADKDNIKRIIDTIKLNYDTKTWDDNFKHLNDFIYDKQRQLTRWFSRTDKDSGWDPKNDAFDAEVYKNFSGEKTSDLKKMQTRLGANAKTLFSELYSGGKIPDELKGYKNELFDQLKNGSVDAMSAVDQLLQKVRELHSEQNKPSSDTNNRNFAADIKSLEGYSNANEDFVNQLIASVVTGQKEYDAAMEELRSHIAQRQEEIQAEQEKNLRVNTEIGKFASGAKPILDAMGITENGSYPTQYGDFIKQIQTESIKGEEAVKRFAEAMGYAYDEANSKWGKMKVEPEPIQTKTQDIVRSQEEIQAEIEETNRVIKIQEDWMKYLGDPNATVTSTGKRDATDQLRNATKRLVNYRRYPEEFIGEMDEEKITVGWWKAMQEAKRQGVAGSTISRYNTDIQESDYEEALARLQESLTLHKSILQESKNELAQLQAELQQAASEGAARNPSLSSPAADQHREQQQSAEDAATSEEHLKEAEEAAAQAGASSGEATQQHQEQAQSAESAASAEEHLKNSIEEVSKAEASSDEAAKAARHKEILESGKTEQEIVEGLIQAYQNLEKQKANPVKRPGISDSEARKIIETNQESYVNEAKKYGVDLLAEIEKRRQAQKQATEEAISAEENLKNVTQDTATAFTGTDATANVHKQQEESANAAADAEEKLKGATAESQQAGSQESGATHAHREQQKAAEDAADAEDRLSRASEESARLIRETESESDSGSYRTKTYELSKGLTRTESYRLEQQDDGSFQWAKQTSQDVANYNILLQDTIKYTQLLTTAQAALKLAQEKNSGKEVTDAIRQQINYYQQMIDKNRELAESYAKDSKIKVAEGTGGIPYTKSQYDADVDKITKEIQLKIGKQSAEQIERQQARNEAELKKNQAEIDKANHYITQQIERLRDVENKYDSNINAQASRGITNETNLEAFKKQVQDIENFLNSMKDARLDPSKMDKVTSMFGELKRFGDNAYLEETAKKGDLSRQNIDSMTTILTNNIETFESKISQSKGDVDQLIDKVNTLKASISQMTTGEQVSDGFQRLKELRTELQAINEKANVDKADAKQESEVVEERIRINEEYAKSVEESIAKISDARAAYNAISAEYQTGDANIQQVNNARQQLQSAIDQAKQLISEAHNYRNINGDQYFTSSRVQGWTDNANKATEMTEKERQRFIKNDQESIKNVQKAVEELAESYIKLAEAQEKANHSKSEFSRESGKAEVNKIQQRQKDIKEYLGRYQLSDEQNNYITVGKKLGGLKTQEYEEKRNSIINTKDLGFGTSDNIEKTWDVLIQKAQRYQQILYKQQSGATLTVNEKATLEKLGPLYTEAEKQAEKMSEAFTKYEDKYNKMREQMGVTNDALASQTIAKYDKIIGGLDAENDSMPFLYNQQVTELKENLASLKQISIENPEWFETLNKIDEGLKRIKTDRAMMSVDESSKVSLNRQMSDWIAKNTGAGQYREEVMLLQESLQNITSQADYDRIANGFNNIRAAAAEAGKTGLSFGDGLIKRFKSLGQYLLSFASFYRIIGTLKQAVNIVKELDSGLMEVRKVAQESTSTLKEWQKSTFDQADVIGGNATQIEKSTAAWLRLGKSFTESQEAAQASVKLLNVSEFENIDDATTSLVSMRQAFKDLTYEDFIDKLNGVGDNFSSSTDQLAQGMQNVSAVLKVQGNDIDQSLALLTAANDITQDMSKASMGVRTVALRIAGTKEAKEELEEYGEDTSDFVVQTASKVDAQVRGYTKTAKTPNGVSVLDENGRLRDTYDILLDIAKVYDDIVEKDNKFGTNSSNALLELLAGKTRSNILASILQNPQLLEDAYEQSKNSQGIGQKELDVYLDSIEARMAKMQNRIQELAYTAFNSDFIKAFVDGLTKGLEIITKIVDVAGTLPTLLGVVGGFMLQKGGLGIGKFNKHTGQWGFGGMPGAIGGLWKKISTAPGKRNTEVASYLAGYNLDQKLFGEGGALSNTNLSNAPEALQRYTKEAINAGNATATVGDALNATSKSITGFSGLLVNAGNLALSFFSTMGTMAIAMAASWALGKIAEGIYKLINSEKILIENGKKATDSINDRYKAYSNLKDGLGDIEKNITGEDKAGTTEQSISKIAEKYNELHDGVNELSNANQNLSTEKYQEYLSLCNQLAEQSPELISGYDAQGNAILNLGNTASEAESALIRMYEAEKLASNVEIAEDIQTSYEGMDAEITKKVKENKRLQGEIESLDEDIAKNEDKSVTNYGEITHVDGNNFTVSQNSQEVQEALEDALKKLGLSIGSTIGDWTTSGSEMTYVINGLDKLDDAAIKELQKTVNSIIDNNSVVEGNELNAQKNEKQKQQVANNLFIEDQKKSIQGVINKYLTTSDTFSEQSDEIQNAILSNLDSLDLSLIEDKYTGQIIPYIYGELIGPISELTPDVQSKLAELFELKPDNIPAKEYAQKMTDIINSTFTEESDRIRWSELFGVDTAQEEINSLTSKVKDEFTDVFGNNYLTDEQLEQLFGLSLDDLRIYADLVRDGVYDTWEELQQAFERAKKQNEPEYTDTFASLLNDETYKESSEKSASNLSSLTGALETLRTEGSLTAEEMVNLQNSFPDLTEFTTESIQTKAFEELDEWIGKIREGMKGMSEEGKEQARTMIQNMVDQYGDLGVDMSDIMDTYFDVLGVDQSKTSGQEMSGLTQDFYSQVEELRSRLESEGLELDTHVLYTLVASDQFSGDADEIYNKYNNAKLNWEITLEKDRLNKDIELQQSIIANEQSKRSYKTANGQVITPEDYNLEIRATRTNANDKKRLAEIAHDAWNDFDVNSAEDSRHKNELWTVYQNLLKDQLDAEAEAANTAREATESSANEALQELENSNNALKEAQNKVSEAEKNGGKASAELYEAVASEQDNQAEINRRLGDEFQKMADSATGADKAKWQGQANDYYAAAIQAEADARESRNNPTLERYNELQNEATAIQHELTEAEQKHQKVSAKTYRDLISNGKAQIRNLQQQQSEVDKYSDDWWNLQNSIDSMNDSIYDWSTTMDSLVYDQAAQLAQTISTAMSESVSETGLTDDTINALKTAFSDLDGSRFDVSDAFYSTADGVKVNTEALQELTEAEFELIGSPLANEIANVQEQLERDPGNSALQDKLDSLMETNAKYFAQYEEMQKALSRNAAIDLAEGTSNAGANYDENYGRVKTYKEAYEKGLTGTDDFKAWTSYLDVYGRDTLEAYEAVSGKIERYFTEDAADGLGNFLTDMEKLGYAAQDADGYWTITADDYDAAAKDMQMGSEWFMDTMNKLEDFGFIHTYVSSLNEAQLKTRDVEEQIADAVQTYSEMVARGASDEELQKQIDHINELESQWQDLDTVTKTWGETTEENRRKEFLGLDDQLSAFEEMYKNADTDAGRDAARKAAEDYVKQFGYTLEEGKFKLSADDLVDYESRFKKGSVKNPLSAEEMGVSEENEDTYKSFVEQIQKRYGKDGDFGNLLNNIHNLSAEELKLIDHADGSWSEGESSLEQICDTLGVSYENADLLIDALAGLGLIESPGVLDSLPAQLDALDNFLATATKSSGAGYQISTDISRLSTDELQTQLSEISTLEVQVDPNSDVYDQLQELKKQTEIQLNIKNSDQTQTQLKEWAETGDRENIAKTFGIDVNSEEVDKYIEQINNMPSDYDLAIHIDDSQFQTLIESITGEPYQAEVEVVGKDKLTQFVSKIRTKLQNNPITQPIVQKVQQFGQKVKEQVTATVKTGDSDKQVGKIENSVEDLNKTTGTAKVNVNTKGALSNIQNVRNQLLSLNSVVATPRINVITGNATSIISQIRDSINQLRDKTVTLTTKKVTTGAFGTAHSIGTTALSRAHANGTQDWTVGEDESALVNEIGQESIVRDGVWQLIPGGPHVEDLRKDDIIFNAEQTEDLIRTGKTARRGQLVAHANGTVPGMSAYVTTGKNRGNKLKKSGGSGGGKKSSGGKGNSGGNKGSKNNKSSKSTDKKLDAFNKWIEKLFDWIEVRLDRIQWKIDLATNKAENAIGNIEKGVQKIGTISKNKNANINTAMRNISSVNGNEQYSLKTKKDNDGVERVTGISYKNIGANNTLINNNLRGANKYLQEAAAVRKKATSGKTKLLDAKKADQIIAKIQSGQISINEYNKKERTFIDNYKQWYDKAMDCVAAVEELKQQLKELQQTKLDNIIDEFDSLTGYAEAVKASSEATVDYYNAAGFAQNTPTDRAEIKKQQNRQSEITGLLIKEISAYKGELINAEKVFGKNSNEYHEAQTKLEELNKSLIESQKTERELAHAQYDLAKTVRGYFIDRVKTFVDKLSSIASLSEKRGTTERYDIKISQTEDPYLEQTRYNNELILKYYEDIKEAQREIAKEGAQISSERYEELYKTITDGESAITSLLSANEDLKESIRTLRWKGYNEFQEKLNTINSDLEHLQGFIRDGDIMDDDAQFTDLGFAQIALIGEQMDTAEKKIRNAQGAISKLGDEYEKHTISLEKYNEELDAQIDIIQDASGAMFDYQQKLADMYIDQITAENDALQDLISARKDALSAKKEYYDYDKTLKSKNKDIAQLQAQINALNGVTNDAAKAKRAQLQAQLAEKQEDLDDTLYNHSIDLQQEGYDKLSEDMQTALDNAVKLINGDQKVLQDTANHMLEQLRASGLEQNDTINKIISDNGTKVHNFTQDIINKLEGEGGVNGLLSSINLSVGTIGDAIKKQSLDSSVSGINTIISIMQDSLGNNISGQLKDIETAIGTLTVGEQEKQRIEQERTEKKQEIQTKLTDLNGQKDTTQTKVDKINKQINDTKSKIETLLKANKAIDNNVATLYENAGNARKSADSLTAQANTLNKKAAKTKNKKKKAKYKEQANNLLKQAAQKRVQAQDYMIKYEKAAAAAPAQMKKNDTEIATLESKLTDLKQELSPLTEELATLKDEITKVEEQGLELELEGSLSTGGTAKGNDNIAGDVKKPTPLTTAADVSADESRVVSDPKPVTNNNTQKNTTSNAQNAKQQKKNQLLAAINSGKSHKKKVSDKEKKEHHALWEYLVKQFGRTGTNTVYTKLAKLLSVSIKNSKKITSKEKDNILKKLKSARKTYGFARGVKDIDEDLLAWTNENADKIGPEMIVRPSDGAILTPMKAGDSVIPAHLADNLFKWGAISPDKFITNPFVGKWSAEGGSSVTNNADYTAAPQTVEMHFDSLFHIEGNVDESVMPRLENLGKSLVNDRDFQKNVIKFVTKDFVRESKKQGIR